MRECRFENAQHVRYVNGRPERFADLSRKELDMLRAEYRERVLQAG